MHPICCSRVTRILGSWACRTSCVCVCVFRNFEWQKTQQRRLAIYSTSMCVLSAGCTQSPRFPRLLTFWLSRFWLLWFLARIHVVSAGNRMVMVGWHACNARSITTEITSCGYLFDVSCLGGGGHITCDGSNVSLTLLVFRCCAGTCARSPT